MGKTDVIMPQMGESIAEGTIVKWLKKPGDKVKRDELKDKREEDSLGEALLQKRHEVQFLPSPSVRVSEGSALPERVQEASVRRQSRTKCKSVQYLRAPSQKLHSWRPMAMASYNSPPVGGARLLHGFWTERRGRRAERSWPRPRARSGLSSSPMTGGGIPPAASTSCGASCAARCWTGTRWVVMDPSCSNWSPSSWR